MWHRLDAHRMVCGGSPGKKSRHTTWKLDLHAPTTDCGTSTRPPPPPPALSPVSYNSYTKGLADLNNNGISRMLTLADAGLIYKTTSDTHITVAAVQEQLEKRVTIVSRDKVRNQSKQRAKPVVHTQQQSGMTSNTCSLLQWRSHRTYKQSLIPRDPLRQNDDVQEAGRINKTQMQARPAGKASAEVQMLVEADSKPPDILIYTDGSVKRGRSWWGSQSSRVVGLHEYSGAYRVWASNLTTEIEAVTHAKQWLGSQCDTK